MSAPCGSHAAGQGARAAPAPKAQVCGSAFLRAPAKAGTRLNALVVRRFAGVLRGVPWTVPLSRELIIRDQPDTFDPLNMRDVKFIDCRSVIFAGLDEPERVFRITKSGAGWRCEAER